jgi:hypothetical protein
MGDMSDIVGYNTNIEIKTIVTKEVSENILQALAETRDGHALIAYRHEVDALIE